MDFYFFLFGSTGCLALTVSLKSKNAMKLYPNWGDLKILVQPTMYMNNFAHCVSLCIKVKVIENRKTTFWHDSGFKANIFFNQGYLFLGNGNQFAVTFTVIDLFANSWQTTPNKSHIITTSRGLLLYQSFITFSKTNSLRHSLSWKNRSNKVYSLMF